MDDSSFEVVLLHVASRTPKLFLHCCAAPLRITCWDLIQPIENKEEREEGFLHSLLLKPWLRNASYHSIHIPLARTHSHGSGPVAKVAVKCKRFGWNILMSEKIELNIGVKFQSCIYFKGRTKQRLRFWVCGEMTWSTSPRPSVNMCSVFRENLRITALQDWLN